MATIVVYGHNSDNHGASGNWIASYPNARNMQSPAIAAVNSWSFSNFGNCPPGQRYDSSGDHYGCGQGFLAFDTGGIVDPTAATLTMVHALGAGQLAHRMELLVYNWGPTVTTASLRTGDQLTSLQNVGFFDVSDVAGTFTGCVFSGSTSLHNYLSHSGFSYFILASANQRNNVTPTGHEWTQWYAADDQTGYRPYLTITSGERQAYLVIAAGTTTFTPVMLGDHDVELWGAGGRTAAGTAQGAGSGGGAFSLDVVTIASLSPISVQVGAASTTNGTVGQDSWFKSASSPDPLAKGGGSGGRAASAAGGAGGSSATGRGTVKYSGGSGAAAQSGGGTRAGSGAGSSAGTWIGGATGGVGASNVAGPGASTEPNGGSGGAGGTAGVAGSAGTLPGGGGGGGGSSSGANGNGAAGRIVVYWLAGYTASATGTSTVVATGASTVARTASAAGTTPTCLAVGSAIKSAVGTVTIPGVGANAVGASVVTISAVGTAVVGDADFSPAQISGLTVRLDASQLGLADGGAVSSWPNLSGTAPSIVGSPAPVFRFNRLNGWPTVEFTVNQGRVRGTHGLTYDYTVLYIGRARGNGRVFTAPMTGRLGPNLPNFLVGFWGTQEDCMYDNGWLAAGTAVSPYPTSWRLYEADCFGPAAGNTSRFFKNGTYLASNTAGLGCGPDGGYALSGDFPDTPEESADCDVAEVLIYNRRLSEAERQAVEGYLAWKWGLQANLPVGHAHKSAAPVGPGGVSVKAQLNWFMAVTVTATATAAGTSSALATGTAIARAVGSASGGAFAPYTPANVAGLLLWIDVADNATITQSGGKVSAIANKGTYGGSLTQPNAAKQFTLATTSNGQALQNLSAGTDFCMVGDSNVAFDIREMTVIVVARREDTSGVFTHPLTRWDKQVNDGWRVGWSKTGPSNAGATLALQDATDGYSLTESQAGYYLDSSRPFVASFRRNATGQAGSAGGNPLSDAFYFRAYTPPVGNYKLVLGGMDHITTGPAGEWRGDIHEVLFFNQPLTQADVYAIEGYLKWKWGLDFQYASHPYKSAPPRGADLSALAVGQAVTSSTGSAAGISTVSGALVATIARSASASGLGTASASGASTATGAAGAAGTSNVLATGASYAAATGSTTGTSSVSAIGTGIIPVAGNAAGSSTAVAVGIGIVTISSVGNVAGSGDVAGTGRALSAGPSPGAVAGTSEVVAVGRAITALVGTASGTASVTAVGLGVSLTTGTAGGAATVSAIGAAQFDAIGEAGGASEILGEGQALFFSTGEAAGQAIVYGEGMMSMTAWPMGVQAVGMVGNASVLWGIMVNRPPGAEEIWSGVPPAPQSPWVPVVPPGTEVWRPVVT